MKKESFGNSRKCLGQKNLDSSSDDSKNDEDFNRAK